MNVKNTLWMVKILVMFVNVNVDVDVEVQVEVGSGRDIRLRSVPGVYVYFALGGLCAPSPTLAKCGFPHWHTLLQEKTIAPPLPPLPPPTRSSDPLVRFSPLDPEHELLPHSVTSQHPSRSTLWVVSDTAKEVVTHLLRSGECCGASLFRHRGSKAKHSMPHWTTHKGHLILSWPIRLARVVDPTIPPRTPVHRMCLQSLSIGKPSEAVGQETLQNALFRTPSPEPSFDDDFFQYEF